MRVVVFLVTTAFVLLQPDGTDLFHFVDGYSSWNAYLKNMMADGTWGDHVILHGAANCFETCVHVISSLPHHHDVMICPEYDVTGSNRLVWVTCMSFTMLVLFHMEDAKICNYPAM